MELITDITPIAYPGLRFYCPLCGVKPPVLTLDKFMSCHFVINGFEVYIHVCPRPECIKTVCEQVAVHVSNGTFNESGFSEGADHD